MYWVLGLVNGDALRGAEKMAENICCRKIVAIKQVMLAMTYRNMDT